MGFIHVPCLFFFFYPYPFQTETKAALNKMVCGEKVLFLSVYKRGNVIIDMALPDKIQISF